MKKLLSLILALSLALSSIIICANAGNEEGENVDLVPLIASAMKTECGGECDIVPTIIVPGIGQSNVWLVDDDGEFVLDEDGDKINCFPCYADTKKLIKKALFPVLATLLTQHNIGMHKALDGCLDICFYMNICDSEGNTSPNALLEEYPKSLKECSDYEKEEIFDNVPLEGLGEEYMDHLYYFAYNSFGNNIQIVDRLYSYIQMVKKETGHDKVNIVPISLGGTVANGLFEYYNGTHEGRESVYSSIHKVIYIVPALDGSSIIGDVFTQDIAFLDMDYLYNGFLEGLMDEKEARLVEILLRLLPDTLVEDILSYTCNSLVKNIFAYSTNMWALVPEKDYEKASALFLSDPSMAKIKEQADFYQTARVNSKKNISALVDSGVKVFDIVDYDYALYNIGSSWNKENADGVIHLSSTSMGVHAANIGETLPENYVQANTFCQNPLHNHISPDRVVDASTGLLPDTTFYFDCQSHESTAHNDILMSLALALIKNDDIEDVYSDPRFPQFNGGRNGDDLRNKVNDAKNIDKSTLSPEDLQTLNDFIEKGEKMLSTTICDSEEYQSYMQSLLAFFVKIGVREDDTPEDPTKLRKISLWLYEKFGTSGFTQIPFRLLGIK